MNTQEVILVTEKDEVAGTMEKMQAHREGLLHRAFSVFVFNKKGEMLLQQRALKKYHGAGLWTNTCCSHPYPAEAIEDAAARRLQEEMGFSTPLHKVFEFTYRADVENNLIEHEYDHVFVGEYEGEINTNDDEVAAFRYQNIEEIKDELSRNPEKFTTWFRIAFPRIELWWQENYADALDNTTNKGNFIS